MKRNILIIGGHPDPIGTHLGNALGDAYASGADDAGHEVRRLDIAQIDFPLVRSTKHFEQMPPPASILAAQEQIMWANHLVIIYPLWLGDIPALLKGFFEQTFRFGFAATPPSDGPSKGLLAGKSARIIVTMGLPALIYRWYFGAHSLKSLEQSILGICGIGPIRSRIFGGVGKATPAQCARWLAEVRGLGQRSR